MIVIVLLKHSYSCTHDIDIAAAINIDIDIDQVSHTPADGVWPLPSSRHQPHLSSRAGLLFSWGVGWHVQDDDDKQYMRITMTMWWWWTMNMAVWGKGDFWEFNARWNHWSQNCPTLSSAVSISMCPGIKAAWISFLRQKYRKVEPVLIRRDRFYSSAGRSCHSFTRSDSRCLATGSNVGEQLNILVTLVTTTISSKPYCHHHHILEGEGAVQQCDRLGGRQRALWFRRRNNQEASRASGWRDEDPLARWEPKSAHKRPVWFLFTSSTTFRCEGWKYWRRLGFRHNRTL